MSEKLLLLGSATVADRAWWSENDPPPCWFTEYIKYIFIFMHICYYSAGADIQNREMIARRFLPFDVSDRSAVKTSTFKLTKRWVECGVGHIKYISYQFIVATSQTQADKIEKWSHGWFSLAISGKKLAVKTLTFKLTNRWVECGVGVRPDPLQTPPPHKKNLGVALYFLKIQHQFAIDIFWMLLSPCAWLFISS